MHQLEQELEGAKSFSKFTHKLMTLCMHKRTVFLIIDTIINYYRITPLLCHLI